ncbi:MULTISPECIES: DNA-binding protein [unclassified Eikenella]|uniref:DNA-binding protein n=1 Tax=unclassified Eikenella TaxID=2639367 RepID=UPI001AF01B43|nr:MULTISPECIES: DNA-binding protein [unclassified Eikenella]
MSELVSSAQLAEMALPILPKSKQGIEHVAKRDGWPFEYIKGQGRGGRLKKFVLSGLPEEIQAAVWMRRPPPSWCALPQATHAGWTRCYAAWCGLPGLTGRNPPWKWYGSLPRC